MLPYIQLKKQFKNENQFRDWYNAELRKLGYWIYTIRNVEILTSKPFDSIGATPDGKAIAIEFKMINQKKCNIRNKLRPSQRKNLKIFTGNSFIIIYNKNINKYKILNIKEIKDNQQQIF